MVKNVKIDDDVHHKMSMVSARLKVQKNVLASALIQHALAMTDEEILAAVDRSPAGVKTEHQSQD